MSFWFANPRSMAANTSCCVMAPASSADSALESRKLPLANHPHGVFHHHAQHAGDRAVGPVERAVRKGVVGLFRISAALEESACRVSSQEASPVSITRWMRGPMSFQISLHTSAAGFPRAQGCFLPSVVRA